MSGAALQTIRHGAVPSVDPDDLCDRLLADVTAILAQRPDVRVVLLSDSAPEMRNLLRSAFDETTLGTRIYEYLDFWHVVEKLAPAAQVVCGETQGQQVSPRLRPRGHPLAPSSEGSSEPSSRSRPQTRAGQNESFRPLTM